MIFFRTFFFYRRPRREYSSSTQVEESTRYVPGTRTVRGMVKEPGFIIWSASNIVSKLLRTSLLRRRRRSTGTSTSTGTSRIDAYAPFRFAFLAFLELAAGYGSIVLGVTRIQHLNR